MKTTACKLRVFVVEDEALVVLFLEDMLAEVGFEVGAVASRMQEALELARMGTFDLAVIDVNLDGEPSYPIAEILRQRGIPFVFATGYGSQGLDPNFAGVPVLAKPYVMADFQAMLPQILSSEQLISLKVT